MEWQILHDAGRALSRKLELRIPEVEPDPQILYEQLKKHLTEQVALLLESDLEYLIQTLYRLDIREADFHRAMQQNQVSGIAEELAELILQRELEKARSRAAYRGKA